MGQNVGCLCFEESVERGSLHFLISVILMGHACLTSCLLLLLLLLLFRRLRITSVCTGMRYIILLESALKCYRM